VLAASAYAVTDELHQTAVEGRHGTALDWAIDTAGALAAALAIRARQRVAA
jgi:VanZ family protein